MTLDLTQILVTVISLIFAGIIIPLVKAAFTYFKSKTENEALRAAIYEAEKVADYTVAGLQADVVEGLKAANADGKLTQDEIVQVAGTAINNLMSNLSSKTLETLEDNKEDIVAFLSDLIEQRLAVSKK